MMGFMLVITSRYNSNAEFSDILDTVTDCKNKINQWANQYNAVGLSATFEILDIDAGEAIYTAICEKCVFYVISHGGHVPGYSTIGKGAIDDEDGDISFFSD